MFSPLDEEGAEHPLGVVLRILSPRKPSPATSPPCRDPGESVSAEHCGRRTSYTTPPPTNEREHSPPAGGIQVAAGTAQCKVKDERGQDSTRKHYPG